ncbi:DNA-packaging protein [Gorillibacterium sp. sgz500922]|uniref:DNA-packaging protein n=1 Tax=Gorillibacterium sp. sgz500922 TaxID=3446694 RepID=UPI003F664A64
MTLEDEVLDLVKARMRLTGTLMDGLIRSYRDEIRQRILNYTRQPAVPEGLKFTWANMVIDLLKVREYRFPEVAALLGENPVDVNIGDTSVKLGASPSFTADAIVTGYAADLRRYRRMGWDG